MKVANEAVQALGGAGYTKDWPVERYYRDAKLLDIGAGTNEIRRMLIGREVIGGLAPRPSAKLVRASEGGGVASFRASLLTLTPPSRRRRPRSRRR